MLDSNWELKESIARARGRYIRSHAFDPIIDYSLFNEKAEWTNFYGDHVKEAVPDNAPKPRGKEVDLLLFADSDHAGDKMTRRSRTGYFIFTNMAPIMWYSKRQSTIETSVFGAEFVAVKTGMEALRGLRCKLRMMGVPLSGPSLFYGDNTSVVNSTSRVNTEKEVERDLLLCGNGRITDAHISTHNNIVDLATKVIPGGQKRNHLIPYDS